MYHIHLLHFLKTWQRFTNCGSEWYNLRTCLTSRILLQWPQDLPTHEPILEVQWFHKAWSYISAEKNGSRRPRTATPYPQQAVPSNLTCLTAPPWLLRPFRRRGAICHCRNPWRVLEWMHGTRRLSWLRCWKHWMDRVRRASWGTNGTNLLLFAKKSMFCPFFKRHLPVVFLNVSLFLESFRVLSFNSTYVIFKARNTVVFLQARTVSEVMQEVRGFFTLGHLLYAYASWPVADFCSTVGTASWLESTVSTYQQPKPWGLLAHAALQGPFAVVNSSDKFWLNWCLFTCFCFLVLRHLTL